MGENNKERCIYCGADVYYTVDQKMIRCNHCGHTLVVAKFENELNKIEAEAREAKVVKEALKAAEKEKQEADARLLRTLSSLHGIEASQKSQEAITSQIQKDFADHAETQNALLNIVNTLQTNTTEGQETINKLLLELLRGQEGAQERVSMLQDLAQQIIQSQGDMVSRLQMQAEIASRLKSVEMSNSARDKLLNDFIVWSQDVKQDDEKHLLDIKNAAGDLLKSQSSLNQSIEVLHDKADMHQQKLEELQSEWHKAQLEELCQLYHQADSFQKDKIFDKAEDYYRQVIIKGGSDTEVYWRILLCHYCIYYQKDAGGELIPIILNPDLTDPDEMSIRKDLAEHMTPEQKKIYTPELKKIDQILNKYRLIRSRINYDVFISVKQKDERDRYTIDSDIASDLYDLLTTNGFKVFNSRRSKLPAGEEFEPYIISALTSAKALIVVGTTAENMNSDWVKNEWSRFQWMQRYEKRQSGKTERLLTCYLARGMRPQDIPRALNPNIQAITAEDLNAKDILINALNKVVNVPEVHKAPKPPVKPAPPSGNGGMGGSSGNTGKRKKKKSKLPIILLLLVLIAGAGGGWFFAGPQLMALVSEKTGINIVETESAAEADTKAETAQAETAQVAADQTDAAAEAAESTAETAADANAGKAAEAIAAADAQAESGDYLAAIDTIKSAQREIGENADLTAKLKEYEDKYVAFVLSDVDGFLSSGDTASAEAALARALSVFPENADLIAKKNAISSLDAQNLLDICPPYKTSQYEEWMNKSMAGIKYDKGISVGGTGYSEGGGYALFNLGKRYSLFTFEVGNLDERGKASEETLHIYLDGKEAWSLSLDPEMMPTAYEVDVSGVDQMRIEGSTWAGDFAMTKMMISKSVNAPDSIAVKPAEGKPLLTECPPYKTEHYEELANLSIAGEKYNAGFSIGGTGYSEGTGTALFNLNGAYSELSFDVGNLDDRGMASDEMIYVYLDNKLALSIELDPFALPTHYTVNLSGANQMKIQGTTWAGDFGIINAVIK